MSQPETHKPQRPPVTEAPDIREFGGAKDGVPQILDKRLFFQLLVFTECPDTAPVAAALKASGIEAVLYLDVNDPRGIGLLFPTEDPSDYTGKIRELLNQPPFSKLKPKPEMTMIGRTYAVGHEQNLADWLLEKPRRNVHNADLAWSVWYPLRRKGDFEILSKDEQRPILMEHAKIGMAWGNSELAHDVRLACHGLDTNDNEFVLGVLGHELHALSKLIQEMRKTQQTSRYIQSMGPFFVAKTLASFPRRA